MPDGRKGCGGLYMPYLDSDPVYSDRRLGRKCERVRTPLGDVPCFAAEVLFL